DEKVAQVPATCVRRCPPRARDLTIYIAPQRAPHLYKSEQCGSLPMPISGQPKVSLAQSKRFGERSARGDFRSAPRWAASSMGGRRISSTLTSRLSRLAAAKKKRPGL